MAAFCPACQADNMMKYGAPPPRTVYEVAVSNDQGVIHNQARRIAALEAEVAALRKATQLCDKHQPDGGAISMCLACVVQSLSAALSRISYLCGEPNEMGCGPYDLDYDESAVVEQVAALRKESDE